MQNDVLSHLAYFEALAGQSTEDTPQWREQAAGLLVVRLFDSWELARRRLAPAPEPLRAMAVRGEVEALETTSSVRAPLLTLVDAILAEPAAPLRVRSALHSYAIRLRGDGQWRLAADAFRTLVRTREMSDVSPDAYQAAMETGYCSRMAGDLDEAALAYDVGEAMATAARDRFGMLRAQVGKAKLTIHRGNLPQAEAELDAVVAAATAADCRPAVALALAERMAVAGQRGQFRAAAVFGYRALEQCDDVGTREAVLGDLATALGDAGEFEASRDAHLVLSMTAQDIRVRWTSMANLLVLAGREGQEEAFESYRVALEAAPLPTELRTRYSLALGEGYLELGQPAAAAAAFRRAVELAEENGVNDVLIRAETALRNVAAGVDVGHVAAEEAAVPAGQDGGVTFQAVVSGVRTMREQAVGDRLFAVSV